MSAQRAEKYWKTRRREYVASNHFSRNAESLTRARRRGAKTACEFDSATVLVAFFAGLHNGGLGVVHTRSCPMHPDRPQNRENTTKKRPKCARVT